MENNTKLILVTGDVLCDNNYYRGRRLAANSEENPGFRFYQTGGGAWLLKKMIEEATKDLTDWATLCGLEEDFLNLPSQFQAYSLWEPRLANPYEKDKSKHRLIWKASEPLLGYGSKPPDPDPQIANSTEPPLRHAKIEKTPEILVIDDGGLIFRKTSSKALWPFYFQKDETTRPDWIVLKLTGPIEEGQFWNELIAYSQDKLIIIVSADQLRRNEVRISKGLSWEATMEDLIAELQNNSLLSPLLKARHLIITFNTDGAFWLDNKTDYRSARLVFDAALAEGEWFEKQGGGTVLGFLSCFTAAIIRELCLNLDTPALEEALAAGLNACRGLYETGHGPVDSNDSKPGFQFETIAEKGRQPTEKLVSAPIPFGRINRGGWMMLDEWLIHASHAKLSRPHYEAAMLTTILGPTALEQFPVARIGGLYTVDRNEIENLRVIRQLILNYHHGGVQKKPLCLGIFGPPGSGKSFGVFQIAKSSLGIQEENILTFNLSQFNSPDDLNGAFHRVRDQVLSGQLPIVFWDEFDSQGYQWLQYLLAPMQDGTFQDGQINHPIGECIFVFAGATSPTYDTFGPVNPENYPSSTMEIHDDGQRKNLESLWRDFVLKKGPDFKSRIAGYLNVLGPNPRKICIEKEGYRTWVDDKTDLCYPIRRALFIRSQLGLSETEYLHIDSGLIQALLEIPYYKAGFRSMELLLSFLRNSKRKDFMGRSRMPGIHLLGMHVDPEIFWQICEREQSFKIASERIAPKLHAEWLAHLNEDQVKSNPNAVSWDNLDASSRDSNLAQALRIPKVIALAGLTLKKQEAAESPSQDSIQNSIQTIIEPLAEAEHNFWMVERMLAGWRYAKKRDNAKKLHPMLIPYAHLPENEKMKDRDVVMNYVQLLKEEGYYIGMGA